MFMAAASASRSRFDSTSSCSTKAASSWLRACRCLAPMRTAPLILSSTAVALCSSDGSMTWASRASIAGSSCLRPFSRREPVSLMADISTASASSIVARRLVMARCAAGVSLPRRALARTTGWLTAR